MEPSSIDSRENTGESPLPTKRSVDSGGTQYHIHAQQEKKQESRRSDLSPGLRELDADTPEAQAKFWDSCIITQSKQIMAIGGLAPDEVFNDIVKRYFDSSVQMLDSVFDLCVRDQETCEVEGTLTQEGLEDAMIEHFQYYHLDEDGCLGAETQKCFDRFSEKIGIPVTRASFGYAIRRFRLAMLLKKYHLEEIAKEIYHIDYDDDFIYTKDAEGKETKETDLRSRDFVRNVWCRSKKYKIPVMETARPVFDIPEYLYKGRWHRQGNVHWVHVHNKKIEMVLALGQVYRLPGRVYIAMRNLRFAQPRVRLSFSAKRRKESGGPPQLHKQLSSDLTEDQQSGGSQIDEWSSLTYPGMCLDYASRRSLQRYERWVNDRKNPRKRQSVPEEPPRVFVAGVEFSIGMIWSDVKTKTLITLCSETEYVGKWMSDIPDEVEKSCWDSCMEFLSCTGGCCCRRQKESGYHQLPQSDSDEEVETERSAKTRFTDHSKSTADLESAESARTDEEAGMHAIDPRTSRITFDSIFEKTLLALGCQNSVLRTGNHEQLMTRIMLNSTQEYLDMASIYAGAIHRLGYLLEKPNLPNKDDLIARTEQARLELEHLVRIVSPFAKNVVPIMRELYSASEVVRFQIEEIDDNISQFLPKCEALIQQCQSLAQQYDRKANDKMNSILNLLTFITFIIIPMQLLTGLYGMNFRIMPELEWKHGYVFFWSLSISLSLLFAIILYRITSE